MEENNDILLLLDSVVLLVFVLFNVSQYNI